MAAQRHPRPSPRKSHLLRPTATSIFGLAYSLHAMVSGPSEEALGYLASRLLEHQEEASDSFARIFGLNEYAQVRGGPGPLVIPAPGVEGNGGAA